LRNAISMGTRLIRILWLVFAVLPLILAAAPVGAEEDARWTRLRAIPGASATETTDAGGHVSEEVRLPSGVLFMKTEQGIVGIDQSGRGAVLCLWQIFIAILGTLDNCPAGEEPLLKNELTDAIDRINKFIVENSLDPVTREQVDQAVIQQRAASRAKPRWIPPSEIGRACRSEEVAEKLRSVRAETDKLLGLSRPPVLNPCL
jgi:predicted transcriptional regulator